MNDTDLLEKIESELKALELPLYKIGWYHGPWGERWFIQRPDCSKVNDWDFDDRPKAEHYLEGLVAFGFCRSE